MKTKRTALVTGATSGIGRAYAVWFAKNGCNLVVTGRRIEKLHDLAVELKEKYGTATEIVKAEFSAEKDVKKVIEVIERRQNIHILVNNAGFGSGVEFCKSNLDEHLNMLHVHVEAAVKLVYAVLPQMILRREGTIINVSSIGAYLPGPGSVMYSGTKLFLAGFSESLQMEVHQYGIKVQCVCPGMTHSDFHDRRSAGQGLKTGKWMWMEPEALVEKSMRKLNRKKIIYVPGIINRLILGAVSLLPKRLYYLLAGQSGNIKLSTGFFNRMKQFVEKAVSLFFIANADQV
jgi:short-subunit dehydrogenase